MNDQTVSLQSIQEAAQRIASTAHETPILTCRFIDQWSENRIHLKAEHLQKVGAFKFRGAQNAVSQLELPRHEAGVITHSSGNHGQALALAARLRGIPAYIVMPENAPQPKIAAIREYGGTISFCAPLVAARESLMAEVQARTDAVYIPPYDHPSIISGQGTIGLEVLKQVPDLKAVIAPVGGGGLLAGIATAVKLTHPAIKVFGAEPKGADDAARSLAAGRLIPQESPHTIADGLLTSLGTQTWPIIHRLVDGILTVSESEIIEGMQLVWERSKQLIEPSAAVAVAALRDKQILTHFQNDNIAVVLSGGNTDIASLPWLPHPDSSLARKKQLP